MQPLESNHTYANITKIEGVLSSGFSLDRLANETTLDRERLERFLNRDEPFGHSRFRNTEYEEKLDAWLVDHGQATEKPSARTPTYNTIQALLSKAHHRAEFIAITGGVGVGKSQASKDYTKENPRGYERPGAFYVEFASADKSMASALERILGTMLGRKAGSAKQSTSMMTRVICGNLRPGDFMTLDECNFLVVGKSRTIEIARDIYAGSGVGIALLGNSDFDSKVYGDDSDFDALVSRTSRIDFPTSTEDDIDCWIQWKGLGALGKRARDKLVSIGTRPGGRGGLRMLDLLINNITGVSQDAPIDVETIELFLAKFGRK